MRKLITAFLFTVFFASQAFGVNICVSLCGSSNKQNIEKPSHSCHKTLAVSKSTSKMPLNCGVMGLLDSLTKYSVNSVNLDLASTNVHSELWLNTAYVDHGKQSSFGKVPTLPATYRRLSHQRPIFLLNQKFII